VSDNSKKQSFYPYLVSATCIISYIASQVLRCLFSDRLIRMWQSGINQLFTTSLSSISLYHENTQNYVKKTVCIFISVEWPGYFGSGHAGLGPNKGIYLFFGSNGGYGAMSGVYLYIISKRKQLFLYT